MFSYLFPKGGLGIEITKKYVRFVHLVKKSGVFHIQDFGRVLIPQGTFSDDTLIKPDALTSILKQIMRNCHEKQIRITLPSESQKFFLMDLPQNSKETLVNDIIFYLKERVLFHHGKDAIVDVRIVERKQDHISVRVVTCFSEQKTSYKPIFSMFKYSNVHINRSSQAAIEASLQPYQKPTRLHVHFSDDISSYSVVENGKVVFYQEFPFSTHRFLLEVQKRLTKPSTIASNYLAHLGIFGADIREFSEDSLQPVAFLLDHAILEYGRETGKKMEEISLSGAFAGYQGVVQILAKYTRMHVYPAYPWKNFDPRFDDSIFEIKKQETLEYIASLGLALDAIR